jgi:hypothetical protein
MCQMRVDTSTLATLVSYSSIYPNVLRDRLRRGVSKSFPEKSDGSVEEAEYAIFYRGFHLDTTVRITVDGSVDSVEKCGPVV